MRLTCPNCGAQYEVPDDVIPESGRDVQCSNCGDTWFQNHADFVNEKEEDGQHAVDPGFRDGRENTDSVRNDDDDTQYSDASFDEGEYDTGGRVRRELDPAVTDVLRGEAEREAAARAIDADESAEDYPQDGDAPEASNEAGRRAQEARVRMAKMRGEPAPSDELDMAIGGVAGGSRRALLPDIEEINSTLRSTSDRRSSSDAKDPASQSSAPKVRRRRGFRRGFLVIVFPMLVAIAAYIFADQITARAPQLESVLTTYVEKVNTGRIWLDGQAAALKTWLENQAAGENSMPGAVADDPPADGA